MKKIALVGSVIAVLFVGLPLTAQAKNIRATGSCHLANTTAQKVIYNGECKITQEAKGSGELISVRLGNTEPMLFLCHQDGKCAHGPIDARMRDRGNGEASFRWEEGSQKFRLDVEAD